MGFRRGQQRTFCFFSDGTYARVDAVVGNSKTPSSLPPRRTRGSQTRRRVIMSPVPVLTYFDAAGRVFGLRACLFKAYGKEGWVDNRVAFKDWRQLKQTTPLGTLPTLTLADGSVMVQTESLARWAAKQAGLYPDDPLEALKVRCVDAASGRNVRPPRGGEKKKQTHGDGASLVGRVHL